MSDHADEDRLNTLASSLIQLNIKVSKGDDVIRQVEPPLQEEEETANEAEEQIVEQDTIKEEPQKTKITLNQSVMLSKLPGKTTNTVLSISKPTNEKIQIRFKSIGSVNQVKPAVFRISKSSKFSSIIRFLELKLGTKVYCYLNNSVSPNPDEDLSNLFDIFRVGEELIVSYCNIVAFG